MSPTKRTNFTKNGQKRIASIRKASNANAPRNARAKSRVLTNANVAVTRATIVAALIEIVVEVAAAIQATNGNVRLTVVCAAKSTAFVTAWTQSCATSNASSPLSSKRNTNAI